MKRSATDRRLVGPAIAIALGLTVFVVGCGKKEAAAPAATAANPPAAAPAPAAAPGAAPPVVEPAAMTQPIAQTWSPEAMEELLAPVALYPDPVLSQVLIASTNPQEVLDAGNWLLSNQNLTGKALDEAATKVGFTPPIRALIHFPETVDMLCMQLDWTTELGQAFVADQQGVLDAVQRLRKQAKDVGNLKSSDRMKVDTQVQDGKEVVVLSPPKPDVVYVPQYDPQAVYAPAPAPAPAAAPIATTAAAPATTTTTTTTEQTGHSTGALVATGLLAFGAGMLVNEVFNDHDDYHNNGYYPNYGYGSMPYYPPYPYRPSYGNGYYPSNGYNRPPNYQHGFNNNNVVVVNNPGGGSGGYWNDRNQRNPGYQKPEAYKAKSPITAAKPNRPELQQLNQRQPRPMPADAKRPSPTATAGNYRNQSGYAGAKGAAAAARPAPANTGSRELPKVQGSYAGATPDRAKSYNRPTTGPTATPASRDMQRPQPGTQPYAGKQGQGKPQGDRDYGGQGQRPPQQMNRPAPAATPASRDMQRPQPGTQPYAGKQGQGKPQGDRGYGGQGQRPPQQMNRPAPAAKPQPMNKPSPAAKPQAKPQPMNRPAPAAGGGNRGGTAVSGANRGGGADRAASQRGKQSMPQGAKSKGGGGNKKQGR